MTLADGFGEQSLAPLRVVAVRARQVHLSAPQVVRRASRFEMRARRAVDARRDRQAERLARDIGGEREQLLGFVTQGLRIHAPGAAKIDAVLEVDELSARLVDFRIARGHAAHARVLVTACAGEGFFPRELAPEPLPALHPQHAGIGEVVVLQGAQVGAEKHGAGLELARRNRALLREHDTGGERGGGESEPRAGAPHPLTTMDWRSEPRSPSSSIHVNSRSPLAWATV